MVSYDLICIQSILAEHWGHYALICSSHINCQCPSPSLSSLVAVVKRGVQDKWNGPSRNICIGLSPRFGQRYLMPHNRIGIEPSWLFPLQNKKKPKPFRIYLRSVPSLFIFYCAQRGSSLHPLHRRKATYSTAGWSFKNTAFQFILLLSILSEILFMFRCWMMTSCKWNLGTSSPLVLWHMKAKWATRETGPDCPTMNTNVMAPNGLLSSFSNCCWFLIPSLGHE